MNKENYLNYWNHIYETQNFFGTGPTKLAKLAEELLKNTSCKKILEIGCGQGRDAIHFSQLGYDVDAIDISENAVEFVTKMKNSLLLNNLNIFQHDIKEELDFPPGSFDFVYSNLALQFFNLDELRKILGNISKILKSDSKFLFSTKKEGDKYYRTGIKINENAYENKGIIRYFYSENELRNALSNKFNIIKIDSDEHINLDSTVSVWWKILVSK